MDKQTVPEGYKQTEVGIIPDDWECAPLKELASFGGGTTPSRSAYERYYSNGSHCWVKTLDLNNSIIEKTEEKITTTALSEVSITKHPKGTVLVAMYGGFNQIGRTGLLAIDAAINQALVAIKTKHKLNSNYLLFNLNFNVEYWKLVASSSRKDPNITSNDVKNYPLCLPPKKEQTAIANALSDVDTLIAELEKLIAKKQAIKTATMQQLLTGRTRLPEFATHPDGTAKGYKQTELGEIPEDWEVKQLGELCDLKSGLGITAKSIYENGEYRCFGGNGLRGYTKSFTHDGEYALIGRQGALCGNVQYVEGKFFASEHALVATPIKTVDAVWLAIYLERMNLNQYSESSAQPGLSAEKLRVLKLVTPSSTEQTSIANILSDMDDEIQILQQRLDKTRQLKQGMMQELLTGKTRLVRPDKALVE